MPYEKIQVSLGQALGVEIVLTALFTLTIFAATDKPRGANTPHITTLAPLAIGLALFLCHLVAVPIDGSSQNPARSLGTAITSGSWEYQWIFWVGPLVGAGAAGLLYELGANKGQAYKSGGGEERDGGHGAAGAAAEGGGGRRDRRMKDSAAAHPAGIRVVYDV